MKFRVRNPDRVGSRAAPHRAGAGLLKYATAIVILCVLVSMLLGYPSCSSAAEEYTFGVVPQYGQRQLFAIWKPILDELQLGTGLRFKLVTAPKIPVFEKAFLNGSYDFVYLNPYHLFRANSAQGYVPIVRDRINLHGILVIRKDSPVRSVSDLNEKVVAFPSPNALGASLLMRADLVKIHHVVISPLYVTSHSSVYLHVLKGLADAGGGVEKTLEEQDAYVRDALRVLYTTREFPSHPVAVHPRIPKTDADKVRSAFLGMALTKEGRELLSKIPMKQPVSTSMTDYAPMMTWGLDSFWVEE